MSRAKNTARREAKKVATGKPYTGIIVKSLEDIDKVVKKMDSKESDKKEYKPHSKMNLFERLELRKVAMAVYTPPFKYHHGYIFDSNNNMVADQGGLGPNDDNTVEAAVAVRVHGWGKLPYMEQGDNLQDEIGCMIADALTVYYTKWNTGNVNGKTCQGVAHEGCGYLSACDSICSKCGSKVPDCSDNCTCKKKGV